MGLSDFFEDALTVPGPRQLLLKVVTYEFLGTLFFQLVSGLVAKSPLATGLAYSAFVFATQSGSGGHLNPAVSIALVFSCHINILTGLLFVVFQIAGSMLGSLLEVFLVPTIKAGVDPGEAAGCFSYLGTNLTNYQILGWEFFFTFALIWVVYASAVGVPGHGSVGPLGMGIVIYLAQVAAQNYLTRNLALNPARLLGPATVFRCHINSWWVYLFAELLAAVAAAALAYLAGFRGMYGRGRGAVEEAPLDTLREPLVPPSSRFTLGPEPRRVIGEVV